MKSTTTILSSLLLTLAAASPIDGPGKGKSDWGCKPNHPATVKFTSTYSVTATPDQVMNGSVSAPGQPSAIGRFHFGINSETETICYDITLLGVTGDYQSPARTATHVHQAARGASGPPRLTFPNPQPEGDVRTSKGCMTGPFVTGITNTTTGIDTGSASGFKLKDIEMNPAAFFCDSHTALYVPGVVRGQLA